MQQFWITLLDHKNIQEALLLAPVGPDIYQIPGSAFPHGIQVMRNGVPMDERFYQVELVEEAVGVVAYAFDLSSGQRGPRLGQVKISHNEPVKIEFTKDGNTRRDGWSGSLAPLLQVKRDLAHALELPAVDTPDGSGEDIDARLRHGGVDPESVKIIPNGA